MYHVSYHVASHFIALNLICLYVAYCRPICESNSVELQINLFIIIIIIIIIITAAYFAAYPGEWTDDLDKYWSDTIWQRTAQDRLI